MPFAYEGKEEAARFELARQLFNCPPGFGAGVLVHFDHASECERKDSNLRSPMGRQFYRLPSLTA